MRISNKPEDNLTDKPVFQKEKVKTFKELNFKEKLSFIWDYYKWWFIFSFIVIVLIAYTIPSFIENKKEPVIYAAFINTEILNQESTTLMDDFIKEYDFDMKGKRIVLDTSLIINRDRADQLSVQSNQKLQALLSAKTLDVIVCDEENFQFYAEIGCFLSLEDVLPKDLFEKYKPYMLTCNSKETDQTIYYGINIRTSKVLADEDAYRVDPIFTICANANRTENAVKFLEFLMKEEIIIEDEEAAVSAGAVEVSGVSVVESK